MASIRRVYKYGTGDPLPHGALYLCTKVQELPAEIQMRQHQHGAPAWLVWHYYEVLTDEAGTPLGQEALAEELAGR